MQTLFVSTDDGTIYQESEIDDPSDAEHYQRLEVPDVITLTPAQVCGHDGDICEILIGARQGRLVDEA